MLSNGPRLVTTSRTSQVGVQVWEPSTCSGKSGEAFVQKARWLCANVPSLIFFSAMCGWDIGNMTLTDFGCDQISRAFHFTQSHLQPQAGGSCGIRNQSLVPDLCLPKAGLWNGPNHSSKPSYSTNTVCLWNAAYNQEFHVTPSFLFLSVKSRTYSPWGFSGGLSAGL